jgi:hypothetical protein
MIGALLSVILLLPSGAPPQALARQEPRIAAEEPAPIEATDDLSSFRYRIEATATVRWSARRVGLVERVTIENVGDASIGSVNLLHLPRAMGGWSGERVSVDGVAVAPRHPTRLSIGVDLPAPLAPGDETTIELRGTLSPGRVDDAFGRLGWSNGLLNLGAWLALPERPIGRASVGDPISAPPAAELVTIVETDRTMSRAAVQASGELIEGPETRGRRWVFRIADARAGALLVDPLLRTATRIEPATGVRVVGAARSLATARSLARDAVLAVGPFARWFGDPPWATLRVVSLPGLRIGQEYPGLIAIGSAVSSQRFVVWHETAHQWWYGLVANDQRADPWVDESLAQFAAALLAGDIGATACSTRPVDLGSESYGGFHGCGRYYQSVYQRGAGMLFAIRRTIGQGRLLACLRDFVDANRFARPSGDDLAAALAGCDPRVGPLLGSYLSGR